MSRHDLRHRWVAEHLPQHELAWSAPLGDASSRQYFRLTLPDGSTRMLMDAPPPIDGAPFVAVAALATPCAHVPRIWACDLAQGFMLLEDLGTCDYETALRSADEAGARTLYRDALATLVRLQVGVATDNLPRYDAEAAGADIDRFTEWYVGTHLGQTLNEKDTALWTRQRALLLANLVAQPQAFVHFDFHSRNLMLSCPNPGVIDFQDARLGALSYDLVSLLKDVYHVLEEDFRLDLCIHYWEQARAAKLPVPAGFDDFYRDFEFTGVFRHLRTLGTFARLAHRDGKPAYLEHAPVVLAYLRETCHRYAALHPLYTLLNRLGGVVPQAVLSF